MHVSALSNQLGGPPDDAQLLRLARVVWQVREELIPIEPPERPAALTVEDYVLLDAYSQYMAGVNVGADKRRQLSYLAAWRCAVWDVEGKNGVRLTQLLDAGRLFARLGHVQEADGIAVQLREVWGQDVRAVPGAVVTWLDMRDWCLERVKRCDVLPLHLRTMRPPRSGVPLAKPAKDEREDGDAQRRLW